MSNTSNTNKQKRKNENLNTNNTSKKSKNDFVECTLDEEPKPETLMTIQGIQIYPEAEAEVKEVKLQYEIKNFIGGSNYCLMFEAMNLKTKETIAIKVVLKSDEEKVQKEIKIAKLNLKIASKIHKVFRSKLQIPTSILKNVPLARYQKRFEIFNFKVCYFMLMDKCDISLKNLVMKEPQKINEEFLYKLVTDLLEGISEFRKCGFTHNMLNPDKILFKNDKIFITGFENSEFESYGCEQVDFKFGEYLLCQAFPQLKNCCEWVKTIDQIFIENFQNICINLKKSNVEEAKDQFKRIYDSFRNPPSEEIFISDNEEIFQDSLESIIPEINFLINYDSQLKEAEKILEIKEAEKILEIFIEKSNYGSDMMPKNVSKFFNDFLTTFSTSMSNLKNKSPEIFIHIMRIVNTLDFKELNGVAKNHSSKFIS
jgi:serine/threonine protein kinase